PDPYKEVRTMADSVFELRISGRKLLLGLLVTVAPVSLTALYTATRAGNAAEESAGERLRIRAEGIATLVRDRISTKVIEAALMASDTAVQAAVNESNAQYQRMPSTEVERELARKDELWVSPEGADLVSGVMTNAASDS